MTGRNFRWPFRGEDAVRDARREMIDQTQTFLNWAMTEGRSLPRIPRRPTAQGGFTPLLEEPASREMVERWWARVLGSSLLDE